MVRVSMVDVPGHGPHCAWRRRKYFYGQAVEKCVLWELDRETFNHIVKDASAKKRDRYENFLKSVPLLEGVEPYERSKARPDGSVSHLV